MPIPAILAAVLPVLAPTLVQRVVEAFTSDPSGGETARRVTQAAVDTLGTDDPANATKLLQDPAAIAALRTAMLQAEIDLTRLDNEDRADARQQTIDLARAGSTIAWGASAVSLVVLATFGAVLYLVLTRAIPEGQGDTVSIMLGALTTMASAVVAYWVGSSAGSAAKQKALVALRGG